MSERELRKLARFWQRRLRLCDWTIRVFAVDALEHPDNVGECSVSIPEHAANVRVLRGSKNQQRTVVHELLHVLFARLKGGDELEMVIEEIARVLVG